MIKALIVSFVLTEAVELTAARLLGIRGRRALSCVFLVNVVTNPAVVYLSGLSRVLLGQSVYPAILAILELGAVLTEALLYRFYLSDKEFADGGFAGDDDKEAGIQGRRNASEAPSPDISGDDDPAVCRNEKRAYFGKIRNRVFVLSLVLNAASFMAGLMVNFFGR